jgi:prepilin-type processing-associated H-X9-DG protein
MEDSTFGPDASLVDGWLSWQGFTWGLPRHNGGGNVVFADGHAEWQNAGEWDGPSWPRPAKEFYPGG